MLTVLLVLTTTLNFTHPDEVFDKHKEKLNKSWVDYAHFLRNCSGDIIETNAADGYYYRYNFTCKPGVIIKEEFKLKTGRPISVRVARMKDGIYQDLNIVKFMDNDNYYIREYRDGIPDPKDSYLSNDDMLMNTSPQCDPLRPCFYSVSLAKLFNSSVVKVKSVKELEVEKEKILQLEFVVDAEANGKLPKAEKITAIQGGTVDLLADHGYILRRASIKVKESKGESSNLRVVTHREAKMGSVVKLVPVKIVDKESDEKGNLKNTLETEFKLSENPLADEAYDLNKRYGIVDLGVGGFKKRDDEVIAKDLEMANKMPSKPGEKRDAGDPGKQFRKEQSLLDNPMVALGVPCVAAGILVILLFIWMFKGNPKKA